jgi:hypothetical protein
VRTKNKPKAKFSAPEPAKSKPNKPEIPDKILKEFLEEQCKISTLKDISDVRAGFLWENGGIQRYRINVWKVTYEDGNFCPSTTIPYSWFVYYYPDEQMIVDKTAEPKPQKEKRL